MEETGIVKLRYTPTNAMGARFLDVTRYPDGGMVWLNHNKNYFHFSSLEEMENTLGLSLILVED